MIWKMCFTACWIFLHFWKHLNPISTSSKRYFYVQDVDNKIMGSAACLWGALAIAFHLGHSRVNCVSLQLHLSFTCSSLLHMSFTCGSLGQQGDQRMLYNWLIRAWRPASTKHYLVVCLSAKALPFHLTSRLLKMPLSYFRVSMKTLIVYC